jgi:hypothetical protein
MPRTSPISVLGAVTLVLFMGNHACIRFSPPTPNDPEGVTVETDPPLLQALQGEGFVVIWTDRDLGWGEELLRVGADGSLEPMGERGHLWVDYGDAKAYRWQGSGESVDAIPGRLSLELLDDPGLELANRGDALMRTLASTGADLYGLPLALVVERDGEAWLDPRCEDELPCWRDEPTWWDRWEQGDLPAELGVAWWAELEQPALTDIELRLELLRNEVGFTLASSDTQILETGRRVLWGDVHSHTNLSYDACEDPERECRPVGDRPGSELFSVAEEVGLDFVVLTDHAEFDQYSNLEHGYVMDIHDETLRMVAQADGGPVIPIVGYEWTGVYNFYDDEQGRMVKGGGHRTVIFDGLEPCVDYWVGAARFGSFKNELGYELYRDRDTIAGAPDGLLAHLAQADETCEPVRHLSWFHHPGLDVPRTVDWDRDVHRELGDRVVEIYSEHGSSECFDMTAEGCDFSVPADLHAGSGSVQEALSMGYQLGFVGGTDSHDARPGSLDDGASYVAGGAGVADGEYHLHYATGGVTGALSAGEAPGRVAIVDAIEDRNTVAASWMFDELRIAALGQDGVAYLPGDDVPAAASPLRLRVEIEDEAVQSWMIEVVDPDNAIHLQVEQSELDELLDLSEGDVRYLRVRAWTQEREHRLWASPFFGVEEAAE